MEKYFGKLIEDYGKVLSEEVGEGNLKNELIESLKDIFNVDALNFILNEYQQGTLKRELGDGELKKRIMGKLEELLSGKTLKKNLLDKPFDYESIIKQNNNLGVRIRNCLKARGIETYRDLQVGCYNNGFGCSWKNEKTYGNYLESSRNLGRKSAETILSHLKEINFDFSKESAKKAAEK